MNKLRFDRRSTGEMPGYWANRPRDAANLARYAGRQLERPLNWQVVTLDREWHDWLDSPDPLHRQPPRPDFTDADCDKLRQYVEAGGMLFMQADGDTPEFDAFARRVRAAAVPAVRAERPAAGPRAVQRAVQGRPAAAAEGGEQRRRAADAVLADATSPSAWQTARRADARRAMFQLGVNLFVYAAGKRDLRNRLSSPYVSAAGRRRAARRRSTSRA